MKTEKILFYYNGIKVNGEKLTRCHYYHDTDSDAITIYARDYKGLPRDLFPVVNNSDCYTDYFEEDRATLTPEHPLHKYAAHAARLADLHEARHAADYYTARAEKRANVAPDMAKWYKEETEKEAAKAAEIAAEIKRIGDPGQPTAADLAAIDKARQEAENARKAAELAEEQAARERYQAQKIEGRDFCDAMAEKYPIKDGAPVIVIGFSESPYLQMIGAPRQFSFTAGAEILKHFDELNAEAKARGEFLGYDKTDFTVIYTDPDHPDDEPSRYEGRYDLGDDDGGIIKHIEAYADFYINKGFYGNGNPTPESIEHGNEIKRLADLLRRYTADAIDAKTTAESTDPGDIKATAPAWAVIYAKLRQMAKDDPDAFTALLN